MALHPKLEQPVGGLPHAEDGPDTELGVPPIAPERAAGVAARFVGYTVVLFGLSLSLPLIIGSEGSITAFKENAVVE